MKALRRFLELEGQERLLVLRAGLALVAAALAVRVSPGRILRRLHEQKHVPASPIRNSSAPERIAWAVDAVSRRLPGTRTCLIRALAAEKLLRHAGFPARVHLGVATDGIFRAHAWVESDGRVIVGETPDLAGYSPLPLGR